MIADRSICHLSHQAIDQPLAAGQHDDTGTKSACILNRKNPDLHRARSEPFTVPAHHPPHKFPDENCADLIRQAGPTQPSFSLSRLKITRRSNQLHSYCSKTDRIGVLGSNVFRRTQNSAAVCPYAQETRSPQGLPPQNSGSRRRPRATNKLDAADRAAKHSVGASARFAAISLDEVIEKALQNNHTLKAARTTIQQNEAQEITANLRPNPTRTLGLAIFADFSAQPVQRGLHQYDGAIRRRNFLSFRARKKAAAPPAGRRRRRPL